MNTWDFQAFTPVTSGTPADTPWGEGCEGLKVPSVHTKKHWFSGNWKHCVKEWTFFPGNKWRIYKKAKCVNRTTQTIDTNRQHRPQATPGYQLKKRYIFSNKCRDWTNFASGKKRNNVNKGCYVSTSAGCATGKKLSKANSKRAVSRFFCVRRLGWPYASLGGFFVFLFPSISCWCWVVSFPLWEYSYYY